MDRRGFRCRRELSIFAAGTHNPGLSVPRIKSAKKRMRQTKTRTARNKAARSELRTAIKKVRTAATGADAAQALKDAESMIDRAGRKNIVHRNTASRTKSRLAKAAAAAKA
jgi:small subunit ribosomal protein S20